MKILIKNGLVIDTINNVEEVKSILIDHGRIIKIDKDINEEAEMVIDAKDKLVFPGFIDMHVHFRDPGYEYKETIETGLKAAVAGGFTAVCTMPNTKPIADNSFIVEYIKRQAKDTALAKVYPIGSISKGLQGAELSEMGEMISSGAIAFSDDGVPVSNTLLLRRALEYLKKFNGLIITHNEDLALRNNGAMNEGYSATVLGLPGIHRAVEESAIARDIEIAKNFGRIHIAHVSCKGSVELIRFAKQRGIDVTAETAPHYFALTDADITSYDTNFKMNPPLRTEEDRLAIIEGLKAGTIDCIATDHAPHGIDDKNVEFDHAAFGIVGLETSVGLVFEKLVKENKFTNLEIAKLMSINPAKIIGKEKDFVLKENSEANITIIDPNIKKKIDSSKFFSKGKNSPFVGREVNAEAYATIVMGKVKYYDGQIILKEQNSK